MFQSRVTKDLPTYITDVRETAELILKYLKKKSNSTNSDTRKK